MKGCAPAIAALLLCAGCLSSSTPAPKTWIVSPPDVAPPVAPSPGAFAVTRQGALTVTAPFDSTSFVVRRADGSVARDPYNVFASPPSSLLRASVRARLEADGRFGRVVPQSSSASADVQAEVLVRDLSLDCSNPDRRAARAAVSLDVLRMGRGARTVVLSGDGDHVEVELLHVGLEARQQGLAKAVRISHARHAHPVVGARGVERRGASGCNDAGESGGSPHEVTTGKVLFHLFSPLVVDSRGCGGGCSFRARSAFASAASNACEKAAE